MIPLATALPAFTLLVSLSAQQTTPEVPFGERLHAETNVAGGLTAETACGGQILRPPIKPRRVPPTAEVSAPWETRIDDGDLRGPRC
jgi:hypothetical protein